MTRTARTRNGSALVRLGSGLLVLGGGAHLVVTLAQTVPRYGGSWVGGELWSTTAVTGMTAANGAFWVSVGSWAVPQSVLGLTLLWMDRRGITPPSFVAWTLGAYAVALGLYSPQPTVFGALVVALLLLGARRAEAGRATRTAPAAG